VHGRRAPLKPWFKINFLDFNEVGDHKVIWELNRHQHLVTLAKAWRFTGREAYATELVKQWHSWQRANTYPLGINWSSSLEVAFRSLSWLWVERLLADCTAVDSGFRAGLLRGLALHGRHVQKYLSTFFSPNTHLLGEAVALFYIGTLCPQIAAAERWRTTGWRILLQEAERQVRPDGLHFEQSLYYHVYALDFFLHARILAARNGWEIPADFDQILKNMLRLVDTISQAGPPEGFGDDDGGRVFNPRRNCAEHMTDPLAIGSAIFPGEDFGRGAKLTEESLWLCGETALGVAEAQKTSAAKLEAKSFQAGGVYVMASSAARPERMVIDAGPQGTGRSGHGHADALSVSIALSGRRCLIDPGSYCYVSAGNERDQFRGTRAHNTLSVDGVDQALPDGPFAWTSTPEVHAERWLPGRTFTLFVGSHTGYCRLVDPVVHRRFVFHLAGEFWLIRDLADGKGLHRWETSWHLAPGAIILPISQGFVAQWDSDAAEEAARLALMMPEAGSNCEAKLELVSPSYGAVVKAQVVRCGARVQFPVEHATLIVRLRAGENAGTLAWINASARIEGCAAYRYERDGRVHYVIFGTGEGTAWRCGPWSSDARLIYCGVEGRRITHLILCAASFVKLNQQEILRHPVEVQRWERVIRGPGTSQVFSSDEAAVHPHAEEAIESCDPVF
jgi:hypothetical protein